jgi:hypothetical protein
MRDTCPLSDRELKIWRQFAGRLFSRPSLAVNSAPLLGPIIGAGRPLALTLPCTPLVEKHANIHRKRKAEAVQAA